MSDFSPPPPQKWSRAASTLSTQASEGPAKPFLETLFERSSHSPPRKDKKIPTLSQEEVEERMQKLLLYSVRSLDMDDFEKLAWMIGVDLDLVIRKECTWGSHYVVVDQMLRESTSLGKRFHAVYNAEGDEINEQDSSGANDNISLEDIFREVNHEWKLMNDDTRFTIFGAKDHLNIEVFRRSYKFGVCFVHAPALFHWYKGLWQNPSMKAADNTFIHVSKWIRNVFDGEQLFNSIYYEEGGYSDTVATGMCFTCRPITIPLHETFERVRDTIAEQGPLIVVLGNLYSDFENSTILSHRGGSAAKGADESKGAFFPTLPWVSKTEDPGHSMVVVGVRKELEEDFPIDLKQRFESGEINEDRLEQCRTVLLIQNFSPHKEFLEMDLAYVKDCEGSIFFMNGKLDLTAKTYSFTQQRAQNIRSVACRTPVDRGVAPRIRER